MHEAPLNQAVGLLGLASPRAPQLLAVVAHGDAAGEQHLLWRLCSALSQLGYGVSVLDATVAERDDNPGLQQLLDYPFGGGAPQEDSPVWNVLPAALGLQTLCTLGAKPAHSLRRLGQALESNGLVVLYGGVDTLVQLLGDTEARPLLCVSADKSALMSSYLALKRLLRKGRMEPTILAMMQADSQDASAAGAAHALRECARNFLSYDARFIPMDPLQTEMQLDADMRHLATRLLAHAITLPGTAPAFGAPLMDRAVYRETSRSH